MKDFKQTTPFGRNGFVLFAMIVMLFMSGLVAGFLSFALLTQPRFKSPSSSEGQGLLRAVNDALQLILSPSLFSIDPPQQTSPSVVVVEQPVLDRNAPASLLLNQQQAVYAQWREEINNTESANCLAWQAGPLLLGGDLVLRSCSVPDSWWKVSVMGGTMRIQHPSSLKCLGVKFVRALRSGFALQTCRGQDLQAWRYANFSLRMVSEDANALLVSYQSRGNRPVQWIKQSAGEGEALQLGMLVQSLTAVPVDETDFSYEHLHSVVKLVHTVIPLQDNSIILAAATARSG
jgi:hypothetical protein